VTAFEFTAPPRILFGPGMRRQAGELARGFGRRTLVVTGAHPERSAWLTDQLATAGVEWELFPVDLEPLVETARRGVAVASGIKADVVVGIGGGSALDTAKSIAVLASNGGDPMDYLEVIGHGRPLEKPSLPVVAIPTTAGTGSEVTRNAVLKSSEQRVKVSLRSATMIPRVALVDPELTHAMPPEVTASTGLDALTQLIEPFTSCRANPMVDALCREGMGRVARSLRRAWADGEDADAREDMALASLFSGLALANAGLGIVHGITGPAGGLFPAAHGMLCAALLPHAMAVNREALRRRQPQSPILARYDEVARRLTGRDAAGAEDAEEWLLTLMAEMRVPSLAACGIGPEHLDELVAKAAVASGTKANPIELTEAEIREILSRGLAG